MNSPFDKLNTIKKNNTNENNSQNSDLTTVSETETSNKNTTTSVNRGNTIRRTNSKSLRIPSGINGFDQLISGGFMLNSINLLSGGPGTGKTIFALQYIIDGILLFNETGIFISFDEKKENVYENVRSLGWDLESFEKQGKFHFVEYSPEQLIKILHEGGGLLDNLMSKTNAKRLVIDSISTFLLINKSEFGRRELLKDFFKLLRRWDVTALLTNEYSPMHGDEINKETKSIFFEVDSMVQLHYIHERLGAERKRFIEVYKMRGTNHITRAVPYKITSKGIQVFLNTI